MVSNINWFLHLAQETSRNKTSMIFGLECKLTNPTISYFIFFFQDEKHEAAVKQRNSNEYVRSSTKIRSESQRWISVSTFNNEINICIAISLSLEASIETHTQSPRISSTKSVVFFVMENPIVWINLKIMHKRIIQRKRNHIESFNKIQNHTQLNITEMEVRQEQLSNQSTNLYL